MLYGKMDVKKGLKIGRFDLFVILLLIIVLVIGVRVLSQEKTWVYVEMQVCQENPIPRYNFPVNCGRVPSFFSEGISEGDKAYNLRGNVIGEILGLDAFAVRNKAVRGVFELEHFDDVERIRNIFVRAKLLVREKKGIYQYQDQPIQVGSPLEISTKKMNLYGIIKNIENEERTIKPVFEERIIKVKMRRQLPEFVSSFRQGLIETDENGRIIAKLLDLTVEQHQTSVANDDGELVLAIDPYYKDLVATLKILAIKGNQGCYFQDHAILVGGHVDLLIQDQIISGSIIEVEHGEE